MKNLSFFGPSLIVLAAGPFAEEADACTVDYFAKALPLLILIQIMLQTFFYKSQHLIF